MNHDQPIRPERTGPLRAGAGERAAMGLMAGACLAVLVVAAWLTPAPQGHGTHTELGLPACTWAVWFDKPCPTCGMTTAFAQAGEGHWMRSLITQPAGMTLCLATGVLFWMGAHSFATGSRMGTLLSWVLRPRIAAVLGAGLVAAWVYKIITWHGIQ